MTSSLSKKDLDGGSMVACLFREKALEHLSDFQTWYFLNGVEYGRCRWEVNKRGPRIEVTVRPRLRDSHQRTHRYGGVITSSTTKDIHTVYFAKACARAWQKARETVRQQRWAKLLERAADRHFGECWYQKWVIEGEKSLPTAYDSMSIDDIKAWFRLLRKYVCAE